MNRFWIAPLLIMAVHSASWASDIQIPNALVKLIDQLDLPARQAGTIAQLDVQEGARVKEGTVLARVEDTEARFAEERAKVELQIAAQNAASDVAVRSAERTLVAARAELKRAEEARSKLRDLVTESEMDKLRLATDQATLAIEKAQHEQAVAQLQRDLKRVEADFSARKVALHQAVAPFPGVIVQIHKHLGDWVEPGDKLLRLIRLDRLRTEAFLDASAATPGLEGRTVTLTVEQGGKPAAVYPGKLIFVSPEIDPINRSVRVLAEFENPNLTLQPGMRGTLTIPAGPGR
jgi:multidrug efflux pump subunit AcrA (membrane-fusion protein)